MLTTRLTEVLEAAGLSAYAARINAGRFARLRNLLERLRADRHAWDAWYVPGRIEVLGKHTDYGGGRSLLCAVERGFCVVATPRADGRLEITDFGRGDHVGARPDTSGA